MAVHTRVSTRVGCWSLHWKKQMELLQECMLVVCVYGIHLETTKFLFIAPFSSSLFFFFFFEYYFYTCKRLLLSLYKGRTCQLCQYAQPSICSIIQYQCQSFFDTKGLSLPFFWQTFWVCKKAELVEHKQRLHLIE